MFWRWSLGHLHSDEHKSSTSHSGVRHLRTSLASAVSSGSGMLYCQIGHRFAEAKVSRFIPWTFFLGLVCFMTAECEDGLRKRAYSDNSIASYFSERTCWWNEVCKREFQERFRCRCPRWSFCRSPGKYFDAKCSMSRTGYIWLQGSSVVY